MKLIKRYTKEEIEVKKKDGSKVKKHLPYYVLVGNIITSEIAEPKKVSVVVAPVYKDSNSYATLELLSEKE